MQLSDCLYINHLGILVYKGAHGALHEVVGGKDGQLSLQRYP